MNIELYFLRSSEQKIAQDMVEFAQPNETTDLEIYTKNAALTAERFSWSSYTQGIINHYSGKTR